MKPVVAKHFISYSSVDAADFALELADKLEAGPPSIPVWLDRREIKPQDSSWHAAIDQAILNCSTMLCLLTPDSVEDESVCLKECSRALRFKKPVVPLLVNSAATPPFLLEGRQYIDFSASFPIGLARLRDYLRWLETPEGVLQHLRQRLADAKRDLRRVPDDERSRVLTEIDQLKDDAARQQKIVDDPAGSQTQTEQNIKSALENERKPTPPVAASGRTRFINQAPAVAPLYFQDRFLETSLLVNFLKDEGRRMATVIGRGGTGKTAMVCRLLKSPDGVEVDGVVYLSGTGAHKASAGGILSGLSRLLPTDVATRLGTIYQNSQLTVTAQMQVLLEAFPSGCIVLLLDNFESLVDPSTLAICDAALDEALRAILDLPEHPVKVIITTRVQPRELALQQPGRQMNIQLDAGLPSPFAENVLQAMDADGTLNLKNAPAQLLERARQLTRGYPRALEALYAILSADRSTSFEELLSRDDTPLPENVIAVLVGEAFSRLDAFTQQVMQAVAVYGHPVPSAAVDFLLQPFSPAVNSAATLNRLVNMHLVRKDSSRYYLHPVDADFALHRIPPGQASDRGANPLPFTRFALLDRAADFFEQARIPAEERRSLADLTAQQIEFSLRLQGKDYNGAARVLFEIVGLLKRWGHFRMAAQLHQQLLDKLTDPSLAAWNLLLYGWAQESLGNSQSAVLYWEKALTAALSPELNDRSLQAWSLLGLGTGFLQRGRIDEAIQKLEPALQLGRDDKDHAVESTCLNELARCHAQLGQTALSRDYYQQALKLSEVTGDKDAEGMFLSNIANSLGRLGDAEEGLRSVERGLIVARSIQNRFAECANLTNAGILLIDQDRFAEALENLANAVSIADDLPNLQFQNEARQPLALAHLLSGSLGTAREIAEAALTYDAQQQSQPRSGLLGFLGLLHLRQGDCSGAQRYFQSALAEAEPMLAQNPQHFVMWDSKGLAACGLALCQGPQHLAIAAASYRAARALTKDAGIVFRAIRLFDALSSADINQTLHGLRSIVAGEEQIAPKMVS